MLTALAAMFLQQTFASVGMVIPAVVAPLVIAELHADPAWVGVYYGVSAAASLFVQMGCGSFIVRYGALRMSQVALVLLGGGMGGAAGGWRLGFGASAIIGGGGAAVSTPTSSQLLGRVSPPRLAPLVFSIKQTAVPAGVLICGFLGPAMAGALGWRGAMLATAAACVAGAVMLQPLRRRFDDDRLPSRRFRLSDFRTTIASVLRARELRRLVQRGLAHGSSRAGGRGSERHGGFMARHPAVRDGPARTRGDGRRRDGWRPLVWSNRRVCGTLGVLFAARDNRRLRHWLGRVRSSGFVGGD